MRPKSIILLVLALGCGLVASIGINQVLANRGQTPPPGETESIFVAMVDVPLGHAVSPENMKLEAWPKDKVPPGALKKLEEVDGRRTRTKLYAGEPILEAKLLTKGASDQGATALIPKGHRVVSVRVDAVSGGSSLIVPGDRVDVLVHLVKNEGKGIGETSTRTILQDVKVFAVNATFSREPQDKDETAIQAKTISLLVTPEQAELVTLATEMGTIRLVMRSPEDEAVASTSGALVHQLLGNETRKSDRDDEKLVKESKTGQNDLVDFLNKQKNDEPAKEKEAQPKEEDVPGLVWTMVLLEGKTARQVNFTEGERLPESEPLVGAEEDSPADNTTVETELTEEPQEATSDENTDGPSTAEPAEPADEPTGPRINDET